jgi:hypothetical protein
LGAARRGSEWGKRRVKGMKLDWCYALSFSGCFKRQKAKKQQKAKREKAKKAKGEKAESKKGEKEKKGKRQKGEIVFFRNEVRGRFFSFFRNEVRGKSVAPTFSKILCLRDGQLWRHKHKQSHPDPMFHLPKHISYHPPMVKINTKAATALRFRTALRKASPFTSVVPSTPRKPKL